MFLTLSLGLSAACAAGSPDAAPRELGESPVSEVDAGPNEMPVDEPADEAPPAPVDPREQEGECGDGTCNTNESCSSCAPDCGECPVCDLAPSCTGALAIPSFSMELPEFSNTSDAGEKTNYSVGVDPETGMPLGTHFLDTDCVAPQLRMRVREIVVVKDGVSNGSANVFCTVSASDGEHSEVMISPLFEKVGDGANPLVFDSGEGIFWGQGKTWQTLSNLTITYQCFDAKDTSRYTAVFDAIQEGAEAAGGIAGPYGWAFGIGSVASGLISAAIGQGGNESRVLVQQTIDASMLLELTNGKRWIIRQTGDGETSNPFGGYYDWHLEVEAWGCSDVRTRPD